MQTFDIPCAGYSLAADLYEGTDTDNVILSLIGWSSNRKKYKEMLGAIVDKTGASALVFDYSGHGDSPLRIEDSRPALHFLEVVCVFDWLAKKHPGKKIYVIGTSYGGYLATQLTRYREIEKLVLRVPAIYRLEDFYTLSPLLHGTAKTAKFRKDSAALAKHPLLASASSFKGKTLVIAHEHDKQVPKETTDAYIKAFNADSFVAKGIEHSLSDATPKQKVNYQNTVIEWLTS